MLELIIAKDSLKSSSPSIDQILHHSFFKEHASAFDLVYSESLVASKLFFELPSKEAILKASQKTEQRLKDEQKLVGVLHLKIFFWGYNKFLWQVKTQKRVTHSQKMMITSEEEKRKQTKQKVIWSK